MPNAGGWLNVEEAAQRLNLHPQRIYPLLRDQRLRARQHGGHWEIDPGSIARFGRVERAPGRPLDPIKAWFVLSEACSDKAPFHDRAVGERGYDRVHSLGSIPPSRLRNRARVRWFHAHQGVLDDLVGHIVLSGARALSDQIGVEKVLDNLVEGYVPISKVERLRERFKLDEVGPINVILHAVDDAIWPFKRGLRQAPSIVAALDLVDSGDERSMRIGKQMLSELDRQ